MVWNADNPALGNAVGDDIADIEENFQCLNDRFAYEPLWIPAGAMIPLSTNGATYGINEYATNDIMYDYYAFDASTEQYVAFNVVFREDYDLGTVKAKFYWTTATGSTAADTVEWEIGGRSVGNSSVIDGS